MRGRSLGLIAASLLVVTPILAFAGDKGPATIDLKAKYGITGSKSAVIFPHAMHQSKLTCDKCHTSAAGGKLKFDIVKKEGIMNDFHSKMCWPCHTAMKVPKGTACATCHK